MVLHDLDREPAPILWQHTGAVAKKSVVGNLVQGSSAYINTAKIPKKGKATINIPGCTTIVFYQAFTSPEAKRVWKENQHPNPLFALSPPMRPKTSSLLVIKNANGMVETMTHFPMNTQFILTNKPDPVGSKYLLTAKEKGVKYPITYMELRSPITQIKIPGPIYGGPVQNAPAARLRNTL